MVQLSIITIDGYGPWTHTLGADREHKLQMYQAMLYESLQNMFSVKGGLVFPNRFDEFFAITDGISYTDHLEIRSKIEELFPFNITMSIANSDQPFEANRLAHMARALGSGRSIEVAAYTKNTKSGVCLIHLDIDGITEIQESTSPYEVSLVVQAANQIIINYCYENKLLGFFMGGDNFVVVSDRQPQVHAKALSEIINQRLGIMVNCGIGIESTPRMAMSLATKNLDMIRSLRESHEEFPRILGEDMSDVHVSY